jgi:hypothetical protein
MPPEWDYHHPSNRKDPDPDLAATAQDPAIYRACLSWLVRAVDLFEQNTFGSEPTEPPPSPLDDAALRLMRLCWCHARAVIALEQQGLQAVPSALVIARAAAETGAVCRWLLAGAGGADDARLRFAALHHRSATWMRRMGNRIKSFKFPTSDRWFDAADRRDQLVAALEQTGSTRYRVPDVLEMCREWDLPLLHFHCQLAKQYDHGAQFVSSELYGDPLRSYIDGPWASDWLAALNMCAWSLRLSSSAFVSGAADPYLRYTELQSALDLTIQAVESAHNAAAERTPLAVGPKTAGTYPVGKL